MTKRALARSTGPLARPQKSGARPLRSWAGLLSLMLGLAISVLATLARGPIPAAAGATVSVTTLTSNATPGTYGTPVFFTATVTPTAPMPTGTVTFKDGGVTIQSATTVDATGKALLGSATLSVAGSPHSLTAVYSGDVTYAASTGSLTQTINAPASSPLWAWGENDLGELGLGNTTNFSGCSPPACSSLAVAPVAPLPKTVVAADAGNMTAGVTAAGNIYAWGSNGHGEVGTGVAKCTTDPCLSAGGSTPAEVLKGGCTACGATYLDGIIAVSGGSYHQLALRNDGTVFTWGYNGEGELGNNTSGTANDSNVPVEVLKGACAGCGATYLDGIVDISATAYTGRALRFDGTVFSWGYDLAGGIGDGTTSATVTYAMVPHQTKNIAGTGPLTNIVNVAAAGSTALAVTSAGGALAWGRGTEGELGNGATTAAQNLPVAVTGLASGVQQLAGSWAAVYALKTDGSVKSWGNNATGELGNGGASCGAEPCMGSSTPVAVSTVTGVTSLVGGYNEGYAVDGTGKTWAWGQNADYGELGNGTLTNSTTPVGVTYMAAGMLGVAGGPLSWAHLALGKLAPNFTLSPSANPVAAGSPVTYTATAAPILPLPTGTVTFTDGGVNITGCVGVAVNGSGQAACTPAVYACGGASHPIVATLTTDTNYQAAASLTLTETVTGSACPTISSISPTFGPPAGGTSVVITGTNFNATCASNTVKFGATSAATPTSCSTTSLTAVSPAGAVGTVDITVTNGSASPTSAADQFTYGSLTLSVGTVPGPVRVQHNEAASGGNVTSLSVSLPSLPALNDLIVVVGAGSVAATDTLTGPAGYTLAIGGSRAASASTIWYKVAVGGESATVNIGGTSGSLAVAIQEWSGVAAASPLDKTASNVATAAGLSSATGTTAATTQASELVIAAVGAGAVTAGNAFSAWSAGFTTGPVDLEAVGTNRAGLGVASQVVVATGTQNATATWTTSGTPAGVIATFKASGVTQIVGFPATTLDGTDRTITSTVSFTVVDTRGSGTGWTISGTGTQAGDGNGHTFSTTATTVTSQPAWSCGSGCTAPNLPSNCVGTPYTLPTGSATAMCTATAGTGQNTMTGVVTFTLKVPASQVGIGTYQSTWTFSIA